MDLLKPLALYALPLLGSALTLAGIAGLNVAAGSLLWPSRTDAFELLLYSVTRAGPWLLVAGFLVYYHGWQFARTHETYWRAPLLLSLVFALGALLANFAWLPKSST